MALTEQQKNIVRIYYPVMKTSDLAKQLGCTSNQIYSFAALQQLSRFDDDLMTYSEIAECLSISEKDAANACSRAIKKLFYIISCDDRLAEAFIEYLHKK